MLLARHVLEHYEKQQRSLHGISSLPGLIDHPHLLACLHGLCRPQCGENKAECEIRVVCLIFKTNFTFNLIPFWRVSYVLSEKQHIFLLPFPTFSILPFPPLSLFPLFFLLKFCYVPYINLNSWAQVIPALVPYVAGIVGMHHHA